MLKLDEGRINAIHANDESTRSNKSVFIIMNFNLMNIYINKSMILT